MSRFTRTVTGFRKNSSKSLLALAVIGTAGIVGLDVTSAFAATILNVDFNGSTTSHTYTGTTPVDANSYAFNGVSITSNNFTSGANALKYSDGGGGALLTIATGVSFTVTSLAGGYFEGNGGNQAANHADLFNDFVYAGTGSSSGSPKTFTINGLNASTMYDLYLYSSEANYGAAYGGTFKIGSTTLTSTGGDIAGFTAGTNYVVFTGLTGSTSIAADYFKNSSGPSGQDGGFNGFTLVEHVSEVPEPASMGLLGLGGLGVLLRRRKNG